MKLQRYFMQLSYKGTRYFGWQKQVSQMSVQETIESALTKLHSNEPIEITGCGRTDTGVHAEDYYAHFDSERNWDPDQLTFKLNLMLPADIAIQTIYPVDANLHARYSAVSRTYHYRIHTNKNPFLPETSWHLNLSLDLSKMNEACSLLLQHRDFECFSKVNTDVKSFDCSITLASWKKTETGYLFEITANRFLRNMVRAIVGTMIEVGTGKITVSEFQRILDSKNRSEAGNSVPAQGLSLTKIEYPTGAIKV